MIERRLRDARLIVDGVELAGLASDSRLVYSVAMTDAITAGGIRTKVSTHLFSIDLRHTVYVARGQRPPQAYRTEDAEVILAAGMLRYSFHADRISQAAAGSNGQLDWITISATADNTDRPISVATG